MIEIGNRVRIEVIEKMAAGILGAIVMALGGGVFAILLIVIGIAGIVLKKGRIFKGVLAAGILCCILPAGIGAMMVSSVTHSYIEEVRYHKEYPIHAIFDDDLDSKSQKEIGEWIQKYKDKINQKDEGGYTVLDNYVCSECVQAKYLKMLLEAGAKRSERSFQEDGSSFFIIAGATRIDQETEKGFEKNQIECAKLLLEYGEDINHKEPSHQNATPLMAASGFFEKEEEKDIRQMQKDPEVRENVSEKMIQWMKEHGADPKLKDDTGKRAKDYYKIMISK